MSSSRSSRSLTARPVLRARSAATHANSDICVSLPPKPPPIRRHSTTTSWSAMPSARATMCCTSPGCCVDTWTCMPPRSRGIGERDLAFEIEVVLAAARERGRAADAARARARCRRRRAATCTGGSTYDCAASAASIVSIAGSGAMSSVGERRRAPRRVDAGRRDGEHRLPGEIERCASARIGSSRCDRADVVDARDVGGRDDGDHARSVPDTRRGRGARSCRAHAG